MARLSINKVVIAGTVGFEPEIKETNFGEKFALLRVVTERRWKKKDAEKYENPWERYESASTWHKISIYNG